MNTATATPVEFDSVKADRVGIFASVLCAIHCAAAPVLLLFLPAFGSIWAHPASHVLVALLVVPLAIFSIRKGYQVHGRKWIMASAGLGILFVLIGAALPAFGNGGAGESTTKQSSGESVPVDGKAEETGTPLAECDDECCEECDYTTSGDVLVQNEAGCVDGCCPTAVISETGEVSVHVPPASIVTTFGGLFLIIAHVGNLRATGRSCRDGACKVCPDGSPGFEKPFIE